MSSEHSYNTKITFTLDTKDKAAFEKLCREQGLTCSAYLRYLVIRDLKARNPDLLAS